MNTAKTPAAKIRNAQGGKIKAFRKMREMSQSDLAKAVGVTKAAVSEWETGKSTPRPYLQVEVAKALGAPWFALFGLDEAAA